MTEVEELRFFVYRLYVEETHRKWIQRKIKHFTDKGARRKLEHLEPETHSEWIFIKSESLFNEVPELASDSKGL